MRLSYIPSLLLLSISLASAASLPPSARDLSLSFRDVEPQLLDARDAIELEKRRGGGGGKGGGGGGGKGSGGKGSGSSSSGSSSNGGRPYSFSTSSNAGGQTRGGSGPKPTVGGGRFYSGGAAVPFSSGGRSRSGVSPYILPAAGLGFFGGAWLYSSVYAYPYHYPYYYRNNTSNRNETISVYCLCDQYSVCSCDDNNNSTFVQDIVGNGTNTPVNSSTVRIVKFANGTTQAYVNGTLPNGTTAAGGTDPSDQSEVSPAAKIVINYAGYWVMVATVVAAVGLI